MALSKKANVKVNLWVTTDGRNRSTWFKRLSFCKSNPCMLPPPLLWLCSQIMNISWQASDTMPRKIFQGFFSDRNPGVRECHRGVKSVCGPEAKDRIYDAPVDDIRWIFSFLTGELLCPPRLINRWAALSLLSLLKKICFVCGILLSREMISISSQCNLCFDKLRPVSPPDQRRAGMTKQGESNWVSSVLNTAFSILHCPLTFS